MIIIMPNDGVDDVENDDYGYGIYKFSINVFYNKPKQNS